MQTEVEVAQNYEDIAGLERELAAKEEQLVSAYTQRSWCVPVYTTGRAAGE